ncbi:DNA polymerase III subunit delta [Tenacibaculum finnmarkense]|uniref:DNA polymerase III subunit delta n=1 Tax=Tenacibaculum finnmarkense genomovar finnmarkense TaxID=1458503 RepID=A0AAP1RFW9_9FLAO|nr:DNA polymerase III subunit delta [Tenacibaculum finnmarkense]MBE7652901.1 DNA polymerase III subunit delta [Tenacibaculum finnmarkense genomovar finnmarkense]MBE7695202.1 DNA polymerase III subunit delta [Tenacibaculum finnmarkense genomovar finnmarkense]MCD8427425.1 DNA polymerase III subunit delta [Tenacibaculum finnmarkense genomovar finnmarkense]MCG8730751.1 DNA polymerase III subunit delta [Tenacibaculum finnmarkense]MCG8752556.1 DNA polymerase III subunit delta [Tenacibaculum finnmark
MNEIKTIVSDIKKGNIKPIYFLMGDEPYYIDKISEYIEKNVLDESEKGFNQVVMYGRDVTIDEIIASAKRYPMMAEKQVIIVKEAQDLVRTIDKLEAYAENPQLSTVLVFNYKYKKLHKGKKIYKAIAKNGLIYESKKLYENQVADWIRKVLAGKKYSIEPKASQMLVEFLGADLSKISNELDKLTTVLPKKTIITDKHIEDNIGVSKDFNNFELRKAIGQKQVVKANRIINYFTQNPKNNPLVMTISLLNSFFTQLLMYHGLKDKSKGNVAKVLGVNPYFVDDYSSAGKKYPMRKVSQVIGFLREADIKSKGVGANQSSEDILKELLFKILH